MANNTIYGQIASDNKVRTGERTMVFFTLYNGLAVGAVPTTTSFVHTKPLKHVQSVDAPTLSLKNERDFFNAGYIKSKINDGYTIESFSMTLDGNDVNAMAALCGIDLSVANSIKMVGDYGIMGALTIYSHDGTGAEANLIRTDVIYDIGVKVLNLPGVADGDNNYTIELYAENPKAFSFAGKKTVAFELWYDDGGVNIVNPNAPNGALVNFVMGTGNQSYLAAGTPVPLKVDAAATGYNQYLMKVLVGTTLSGGIASPATTDLTFATSTATFTVAPTDGYKLFISYAMDTTSLNLPGYRSDLNPGSTGVNGGFRQSWQVFIGE